MGFNTNVRYDEDVLSSGECCEGREILTDLGHRELIAGWRCCASLAGLLNTGLAVAGRE
jgi:hypothetical protein